MPRRPRKIDEKLVKDWVKRLLRKHGAYYHMPVLRGMGATALDFNGVCRGVRFDIETKRPGACMTPRQEMDAEDLALSGSAVFLIDGTPRPRASDAVRHCLAGENLEDLETWLKSTYLGVTARA